MLAPKTHLDEIKPNRWMRYAGADEANVVLQPPAAYSIIDWAKRHEEVCHVPPSQITHESFTY